MRGLEAIPYLEKQGMLSRALSLATVTLLVGCLTAGALLAENLEAGKSPSQIFSGTCNACHKSPRGLLKTVAPGSLPGFLRQHYTTSSDMASLLSSFLISNGATDTRFQGKDQAKTDAAKGAKQQEAARPDQLDRFGRRQNPAPPTQEASRPDDGITPQDGRTGRDGKRRPGQTQDAARPADGQTPVQAATDSKTGAKQKHGKRGKPVEEPPKTDEAAKEEQSKTAKVDAKGDVEKPDAAKPADEGTSDAAKSDPGKPEPKSETAKVDAPRESVGSEPTPLRSDPVPPVTPAPPASAAASGTPEVAASPSVSAAAPAPPEVTASAPPPPPVAPAGPPAPPISQ